MKSTPAFELRDVSYVGDRGKKILDSINWTVQAGEHWAILGPNGSGKTTLLKLASGYLWPNAGGEILRGILWRENVKTGKREDEAFPRGHRGTGAVDW